MPNESITHHISPEELADYFAAILAEERTGEIEEHIAVCLECTKRARQASVLTDVLEGWTARSHGVAYQQTALARALHQAQERVDNPRWRERLQHWETRWAGQAGAALRLMFEAPGRAVRVVTEGLEGLASPGAAWDFALASGQVRVRGGAGAGAVRTRGSVRVGPRTSQVRIDIHGNSQEVEVRVDDFPQDQMPPLVLLIPMEAGKQPQVTELQRPQEATYLTGHFADVDPGEYVVAFEPIERSGT